MNQSPDRPELCRRKARPRPGFAIVSVIVLLVVATALFGLWARAAVRNHRQLEYRQWELQAIRLAEAGIGRAKARIDADPTYTDETWTIPATELKRKQGAEVRIRVVPNEAGEQRARIEATADFPAGAVRRARHTKQVDISLPSSTSERQP
jgi:type II secretory pathway component PulK